MSNVSTAELPTFSIVVPVRNGATTISACVESLLAQHYPAERYDVIVVDNGSTDETARLVAAYPVMLLACPRLGPAPARNTGMQHSHADIIAFTDADCCADREWLRSLAGAFADHRVGGAGGAIEALCESEPNNIERFSAEARPLRNESAEGEFLPHLMGANAAYRRAALLAAGGWDEGLATAEDVELAWRFQLRTGTTIAYCPQAIIYHRQRSTVKRLARQYWVYGLGEVLLDTLFRTQPGYPRNARFYRQRLARQLAALPRYVASGVLRGVRRVRGRATSYEAVFPWLMLVAEGANVAAKLAGLQLSRGLRDPEPLRRYVARAIPSHYVPARLTAA